MKVTNVRCPEATATNPYYGARYDGARWHAPEGKPPSPAPVPEPPGPALEPAPLLKLPLGSVRPEGWLRHQLELMARGMSGRLRELSRFLKDSNGWFGGEEEGWEEQPYWLRGFYRLAVLTGEEELLKEAERWVEAVIESQDDDGYFGARFHKVVKGRNGATVCDVWPHMVMIDALRSHFERAGDKRVPRLLSRFFAFCRDLPDSLFMPSFRPEEFGDWKPFIQHARAGDMIPHIHWLYERTGEEWLLALARRFSSRILPPADEWLDRHIVHFTQRFSYPAMLFRQTGDRWYLEASEYWYRQHMGTWGQQPGGIFGADECLRAGFTDPRQGFETCGMVEFLKSFSILGRITGEPRFADRAEDIMLNHFPASHTPLLKALHYLTASNQPQLDASEAHLYHNQGRMISYSPHDYRCCQHNAAMGWPLYAENLWQATPDLGLAAWLYAPSVVSAKVGASGGEVRIRTETGYPFTGRVAMSFEGKSSVRFPLYLRIPGWCRSSPVWVNGKAVSGEPEPGTYVRIEGRFGNGDRVEMDMAMEPRTIRWPRTGSVSVSRGPLIYSLAIGERWKRCGGTDDWPEWEVLPTRPWNYGLALDDLESVRSWKVVVKEPIAAQPWTVDNAPVEVSVKGRRIPGWGLENETVQELKIGPIRSSSPEEMLALIPLGCARLRISCFPAVSDRPDAREWAEAPRQRI